LTEQQPCPWITHEHSRPYHLQSDYYVMSHESPWNTTRSDTKKPTALHLH